METSSNSTKAPNAFEFVLPMIIESLQSVFREVNARYGESAVQDELHRFRNGRDISNRRRGDVEACLKKALGSLDGIGIHEQGNCYVITFNDEAAAFVRKVKHPRQAIRKPKALRKGRKSASATGQEELPGMDSVPAIKRPCDLDIYMLAYMTDQAGLIVSVYFQDRRIDSGGETLEIPLADQPLDFPIEIEQDQPEQEFKPKKGKRNGDSAMTGA